MSQGLFCLHIAPIPFFGSGNASFHRPLIWSNVISTKLVHSFNTKLLLNLADSTLKLHMLISLDLMLTAILIRQLSAS